MNLKIVKPDTLRGLAGKPTVNFATNGSIGITPKGIEKIKAATIQMISFVQDEDKPSSWHLMLDKNGLIKLRSKNKGGGACACSSIKEKVYDSFGHSGKRALKFVIGDPFEWNGNQLYPLELIKETFDLELPKDNKPYEFQKKN